MKIDWLFVKFVLVGILNTAFGYLVFALLLFLGLHYTLAVILSTIAGVLFNFKTTGTLVFKMLGIIILRAAELAHINLYFAGLVSTGICAIISFLLNKNWVFKYEKN